MMGRPRAYSVQSTTIAPHSVVVSARSERTSEPEVIGSDAPLGLTSVSVAIRLESGRCDCRNRCRSIGPLTAYGELKAGEVKVAACASFGLSSVSHWPGDASPAVHCSVFREQSPLATVQGRLAVPAAGAPVPSEPSYSDWAPLPDGAAPRYHLCGVLPHGYRPATNLFTPWK